MRPRLSVSFKSGHLIYSNGENPPLIRKRGHIVASTLRCLSGKLLSAALASSLQNETAALGLHALTEAMSLLAPMVVGLECHLQCKTPPSRDLRASIHSERMLSLFKITIQCTVYNSERLCVKYCRAKFLPAHPHALLAVSFYLYIVEMCKTLWITSRPLLIIHRF